MSIVHLTASPFYGGPERQMLGLACATPSAQRPVFLCFGEHGLANPFMEELRSRSLRAIELHANTPHLLAAADEVAAHLCQLKARVLLCHGYKPDIVGYLAARRAGVPVVSVSRGWTGATLKVKGYEWLDRRFLRRMDHVICVSEGQAVGVRQARVPESRLSVIRNAIDVSRFSAPDPAHRARLEAMFHAPPRLIVVAAGRLSPEKGFNLLIQAAKTIHELHPEVGFVLVGEGTLREALQRQVDAAGLQSTFIITGFRRDLDALMPAADLFVQSSFREGLPNVVLEAMAASLPVVATTAGGTAEVVVDHETGLLVSPGDSIALTRCILTLIGDRPLRRQMGELGARRVARHFTFEAQYRQYAQLLQRWAPLETSLRFQDEPAAVASS